MSVKHIFSPSFQGLTLCAPTFRAATELRAPHQGASEASWLPLCRAGQDQGADGACAVFTIAEWAVVMQDRTIGNDERLDAYDEYLTAHGMPADSGLTFMDAYQIATERGWIVGCAGLQMVLDFQRLDEQPLLLGYEVDEGWQDTNAAGCIDHRSGLKVLGNHAVLAVSTGRIGTGPVFAQFNNWWGNSWGWHGFGQMTMDRHDEAIREMWRVIL